MQCTSCTIENSDDSRFCKNCGRALPAVMPPDVDRTTGDLSAEDSVQALLKRAYEARQVGDTARAVMHCREALHLQPNTSAAHALLVQLYTEMGERDLAIHAQQRVVELNPDSFADRVELDDLRHAPPQVASRPMMRFNADAHTGPGPLAWAALVAAGAALMFLGGLFALQMQRRDASSTLTLPPNVRIVPDSQTTGASTAKVGSRQTSDASAASTPTDVGGTAPYYTGLSFPPPIIVEPVPYPQRVPTYAPPAYSPEVMPVHIRSDRSDPALSARHTAKSSKLLLPGDDGTDSQVIVRVTDPKHTGNSAEDAQPVINIKTASTGDSTSAPSSHDARTYMRMGDTQRVSGEFDRAIASYKLALAGAGDDEGYVYQQIAACYQKRGDKDSAINNYTKAISAYQRLVDAGRNVEDAKSGIRACESSIKTCNF